MSDAFESSNQFGITKSLVPFKLLAGQCSLHSKSNGVAISKPLARYPMVSKVTVERCFKRNRAGDFTKEVQFSRRASRESANAVSWIAGESDLDSTITFEEIYFSGSHGTISGLSFTA